EPGGVAVRRGAEGGGQAIQEGRERDGGHLEYPAHRGEDVPAPRCAGTACGRRARRSLLQRSACSEPAREDDRRLISFTHFLTRPRSERIHGRRHSEVSWTGSRALPGLSDDAPRAIAE